MNRRIAVLLAGAVILSIAALKFLPVPYLWIAALWLVVSLYGAVASTRVGMKALSFNLGVIVLTLGVLEAFYGVQSAGNDESPSFRYEGDYTGEYFIDDALLGYVPVKNIKATAARYYEERKLYDVTYTIDTTGLRVSPPSDPERLITGRSRGRCDSPR